MVAKNFVKIFPRIVDSQEYEVHVSVTSSSHAKRRDLAFPWKWKLFSTITTYPHFFLHITYFTFIFSFFNQTNFILFSKIPKDNQTCS